jgi:hypothetical protein
MPGNGNGDSPGDHGDEGAQNEEARGYKQDDQGKVNKNFESAIQVRFVGRRLTKGHVGLLRRNQAGSLRSLILQAKN